MGRIKRNFDRPAGKRSAKLIVIATEGRRTERIYFEALAEEFVSTRVHVEVIDKIDDNSSPDAVLGMLNSFADEYNLDEEDQLWMVIDRDSWTVKTLGQVAQICHQKRGYFLAVSNPSFELWLILHLTDVSQLSVQQRTDLFNNTKVNRTRTYSKKMLSDLANGYNESKYDPSIYMPLVKQGIENAIKLDTNTRDRWPNTLGTRVYRLVINILKSTN